VCAAVSLPIKEIGGRTNRIKGMKKMENSLHIMHPEGHFHKSSPPEQKRPFGTLVRRWQGNTNVGLNRN
jgi:hypothetical protein